MPAFKAYVADNFGSEGPMRGAEFASYLQEQEALFRELLGKQA
jgi:hypothetical protein